jgi:NAD kinase
MKIENRVIVVVRETRLEKLLAAQNTLAQAKFYVNRLGGDFDDYEDEHRRYGESVRKTRAALDGVANTQLVERRYLPNFIFAPGDIVVAVGQDGLVANILKYLNGQPLIGVNPDKDRWDGVLLPFCPENAARIVEETALGKRKFREVTMACARLQNGQELLAVNDFFIGQRGHCSARYVIKFGGVKEPQSSSGIIVSTGLGSTGWMKSVIAGAKRISESVIGRPYGASTESQELSVEDAEFTEERPPPICAAPAIEERVIYNLGSVPQPVEQAAALLEETGESQKPVKQVPLRKRVQKKVMGPSELSSVTGKWSSSELLFAVREPFPSKTSGTNVVFGKISGGESLRVESLMGENGVIFSDGIESDFIAFNSGAEAVIGIAGKKGVMVV